MTRKLKSVLVTVFAMALSSSAQFAPTNARIGSMADIFTINDISNVYRYAAKMNDYKDDIQVTFTLPMLGIKSIGEKFSVGAYVREGLVLDQSNAANNFYTQGRVAVNNATPAAPDVNLDSAYIPHLLLGMAVSGMNIGLDLFYEWARTRFDDEYTTGASKTITEERAKIKNFGAVGSLQFGLNDMPIMIKFGFSLPKIKGTSSIKTETSTTENEVKSDKGLLLEVGGEAGIPLFGGTFTPGIDFIAESYSFKNNSADPANKFRNTRCAIYAGLEKKAFDNGLWSVLYQMRINGTKNDALSSDSANDLKTTTLQNILSAGAENGWDSVWVFDKVFLRGGVGFKFTTPFNSASSDTADLSAKGQTVFNALPTIGVGIAKGIFELDARVDLANWGGLATGPDVLAVTGTLRF